MNEFTEKEMVTNMKSKEAIQQAIKTRQLAIEDSKQRMTPPIAMSYELQQIDKQNVWQAEINILEWVLQGDDMAVDNL